MKKFTKKEKEKIRKYFNGVDCVDQVIGAISTLEKGLVDCCLFCHLAIALDWTTGEVNNNGHSYYEFEDSFFPGVQWEKREFFYNKFLAYLKNRDDLKFDFDSIILDEDSGLEDFYNDLIERNKGKFGDFIVNEVLV